MKSAARLGFDTVTRLNATTAHKFYESGFRFCLRYISRQDYVSTKTSGTGSMSREEAEAILGAGLALMPVQFAKQALQPTPELGAQVGANAASNCAALGFPEGCSVWCDVEAVHSQATTEQVLAYCNAWYDAVASAGYKPGIYVGPNSKLSSAVLYTELKFKSYWKSASWVGQPGSRGYQLFQSLHQKLHGVWVDFDVAAIDSKQGRPYWLAPLDENAAYAQYAKLKIISQEGDPEPVIHDDLAPPEVAEELAHDAAEFEIAPTTG